jgi:hypothetical protein
MGGALGPAHRPDASTMAEPDLEDVTAWEDALHLLRVNASLLCPYGREWRDHAAAHLRTRLDASFREGPVIRTEQQALALIRGVADSLLEADTALKAAAEALKNAGKGYAANQAWRAHLEAAHAAQELIGT